MAKAFGSASGTSTHDTPKRIDSVNLKKWPQIGIFRARNVRFLTGPIIIQIGLKSDPPLKNSIDLREKISIPELAQLLRNAKAYIGPIGGLMHLARFVRCPSVVLLTGEPEAFIGYSQNINLQSNFPCSLCSDLVINPIHDTCPHNFACIKCGFTAKQITEAVHKIQKSRMPQPVQISKYPQGTPGISELLVEFNS